MVSFKEAAQKALSHFRDVIQDAAYQNICVEEIEKSEDGQFWLVTIGYDAPTKDSSYALSNTVRRYKVFKVDILTEEVVSMKVRNLE